MVEADLALHVVDAANGERDRQIGAVRRVLEEVGATEVPVLDVYNKADALNVDERRRIGERNPTAALISARTGESIEELIQMVAARVALDTRRVTITFDSRKLFDRQRITRLYRVARVISHVAAGRRVVIEADVPRRYVERVTAPVSVEEAG